MYLFLAEDLAEVESGPDPDEFIEKEEMDLDELMKMIDRGQIKDSKTIIGIYTAMRYLREKE